MNKEMNAAKLFSKSRISRKVYSTKYTMVYKLFSWKTRNCKIMERAADLDFKEIFFKAIFLKACVARNCGYSLCGDCFND